MTGLAAAYPRSGRAVGVIHFGLGAFHRGHQAIYFDDALRNGLGEWGSYGISPRSATVTDILRKQQFLYTVNARQGEHQDPRVVGSIFNGSVFDIDNPELSAALISPELKLLTITVTEKAYVSGIEGVSMPNRILDMLTIRYRAGLQAPTLISCDNLPENGAFLHKVLMESASERHLDLDFQRWISNLHVPNSMVDRIVPAITPEAIARFENDFGYRDESLISTEPYRQWVVAPHPANYNLQEIGVELADDVSGYERLKLRLFNGAHSSTAYFSQLSNLEYVYQAMQIPEWENFVASLQNQLASSFVAPSGVDVSEYAHSARLRISNSAVAHRSAQIAMDGSAKLPQRLFKSMNALAIANQPRERLAFAIALWVRFLQSELTLVDPFADVLRERARSSDPVAQVMQTSRLRDAVIESEWPLIESYLRELQKHRPIEVASSI